MPLERQTPAEAGVPSRREQLLNLPVWLATGSYVGLVPFMPGTFGALWGIPVAYALAQLPAAWLAWLVFALAWGASVPICTMAAHRLRSKDPGAVVLDEIMALPVVYAGFSLNSPAVLVTGFVLFRIFDITKPPPVRQLERLPRGLGIMADDLVAALYAQLCLRILVFVGLL